MFILNQMQIEIIKILSVPQPFKTSDGGQYYWIYGLGKDNKMYIWHEQKADWVLHANNQKSY